MAEYGKGDRIVKMSGVCAGKYGTVNSVFEDGTLSVTFDGERFARFCDPERCGKVAANARAREAGITVNSTRTTRNGTGETEPEVMAAYRAGCKLIVERIAPELKKLRAYVAQNEDVHNKQPARFRDAVNDILGIELSAIAVNGWR